MIKVVIELEKEMIEVLKSRPAIAIVLMQEILSSIPEEQPQPKPVPASSLHRQELYIMIRDLQHELSILHASYGNATCYTEQQALQSRINFAAKELNRLMTIAQC